MEMEEQNREIMEKLDAAKAKREKIADSIIKTALAPKAIAGGLVLAKAEQLQGASSPTSDDWREFAEETPEERARIVDGWKNLEAALA